MAEYYRGINQYYLASTGEYLKVPTSVYNHPGQAKAQATRYRNARYSARGFLLKSEITDKYEFFEFEEAWVERAVKWERV